MILDAAWLDYKNASVNLALEDVRGYTASLPSAVADDAVRFRVYRRQLWISLLSSYISAPLREVFPRISVTRWAVSVSRSDFPLLDWYNRSHPRTDIGLFTATQPNAYDVDIAFAYNQDSRRSLNQRDVDAVYTDILSRQVSADAYARYKDAPHLKSVVWVARVVRDIHDYESPMMSREAYREALRHIWLRAGREYMAVYEIEDAAAIYREMLAHHELLENGTVINTETPAPDGRTVFWSGVRSGDWALVRVTNPLDGATSVDVSLWPGTQTTLKAPPGGATHILFRGQ